MARKKTSEKTEKMTEIEKNTIEMMKVAEAAREKLDASALYSSSSSSSPSSIYTPLSISSDSLSSVTTIATSDWSSPVTWGGSPIMWDKGTLKTWDEGTLKTVGGSAPDIVSGGASMSEPIYAESFLPHLVRAKEEGIRQKIEMDTVVIDRGVAVSQGLEHADMILGLKVKYAKEGSLPMDSAFVIMKDVKAEAERIEKEKELEEKIRADERKKAIADAFRAEEEYGWLALKEEMELKGKREATIHAEGSPSSSSSPVASLLSGLSSSETLPLTTAEALTARGGARFLVLENRFVDDSGYGPTGTEGELLLAIDKIVGVEYNSAYYEEGAGRLAIIYQVDGTTKTLSILTEEEQQRVLRVLKSSRF